MGAGECCERILGQIGSSGSLLTGSDGNSTTFAGAISGAGALTKAGQRPQ